LSITLDIYPEIIKVGQGLNILVRNPTSTVQDITVHFVEGNTEFAGVIFPQLAPGESRNVVVTAESLGLNLRTGKTITAYATIPTPFSGTYLLGSNLTPETKSNALVLKVASTVRVTVLDDSGKAVPYAKVNLFDQQGYKAYSYVAGYDGVAELPERPNEYFGKWLLEVVKYDPDRQLVCYNILQDYDFTQGEVTCTWAKQVYVELKLVASKSDLSYIDIVKNIYNWLPAPVRSFIDWLAGRFGWNHDTTINATMVAMIHEIVNKNGGNVVLVKQEGDTLRIGFIVGYGSPVAWSSVIPIIASIIKWLIAFAITYVMSVTVVMFSPVKMAEVQKEVTAQQSVILDKLKEAYNTGALDSTTYNEAVKNYSEAYKTLANNLPVTAGIPTSTLIAMVGMVLMVVLVISIIKTLKR